MYLTPNRVWVGLRAWEEGRYVGQGPNIRVDFK